MIKYRKIFSQMFDNIKHCSQIDILDCSSEIPLINEAEIEDQLNNIESFLGCELDSETKQCVFFLENISLYWGYELDDGEYETGGEFRLYPLSKVLSNCNTAKLWNEDMKEDEKKFYKRLIPFDDHPNTGDGVMSVFKTEDRANFPEIWIYDDNGICHRTSLNYPDYLKHILKTKGFYRWQYLFCEIDLSDQNFSFLEKRFETMLRVLPLLFPDENYSEYILRYEKLKSVKSISS